MNQNNHNILIKDPYLSSATKTQQPQRPHSVSVQPGSFPENRPQDYLYNKQLQQAENSLRRMNRAFTEQQRFTKKVLNYQTANNQFHQAMKIRNMELNNKVQSLAMQNHMMNQRYEEDYMKSYQEKDVLVKKFENQTEEILELKKTINILYQCKAKLDEELGRMSFILQKETEKFNIQMKEAMIRMENMETTMKRTLRTKDDEICQLRNRIKAYQDENKRLNDENRTLQFTKHDPFTKNDQKGIDNLSQINPIESNKKNYTISKQNINQNSHYDPKTLYKELEDQRNENGKLQQEIERLKKRKIFDDQKEKKVQRSPSKQKQKEQFTEASGFANSLAMLRNSINKEVFDVFFKSVRDGEKHRSNSLIIFIENWRNLDIDRIEPYMDSYFKTRGNLKDMVDRKQLKGTIMKTVEECLPMHVGHKKGRNEINTWILQTIQFTKNQRQTGKKNLNNALLFLFRLLTVQYRITYPMQGKSYTIDSDVKNELLHEIIKAIKYIIQQK